MNSPWDLEWWSTQAADEGPRSAAPLGRYAAGGMKHEERRLLERRSLELTADASARVASANAADGTRAAAARGRRHKVPRRLGQLHDLPVEARVDAQLAAEPRRRLEAERLVEHVLFRVRRVVAGIFQLVEEGVRQHDVARRAGRHALARAPRAECRGAAPALINCRPRRPARS